MPYLIQSTKMGTWKTKKIKKQGRKSQESGKKKGILPEPLFRWMAKHNRSYKHPLYGVWAKKYDGNKVKN